MEIDIRRTRTCQRCKQVVLLDKVRLFPRDNETNILVCEVCCEELKKNTKDKVPTRITNKISALPAPEYKGFLCTRCTYAFRVDSSKVGVVSNLYCPYCGKSDRLTESRGRK